MDPSCADPNISLLQIQLTPSDADASEGGFDFDSTDNSPEAMEAWMKTFREGQVKQVQKNEVLRERLIQIANEARDEGII